MNRWVMMVLSAASVVVWNPAVKAQDPASRAAAAAADQEIAEERYQRLNSAVENLMSSQVELQRRLAAVAEELRRVRADLTSRSPDSSFVTREEFAKLVDTVREVDRKREADKRQILEEISNLGKTLSASLREPPKRAVVAESPPESGASPKPDPGGDTQKGVWYVVEKGNTLSAIVAAHNETFKPKGRRTSIKLVQEANAKVNPNNLLVGQKLFIPLIADKPGVR